MNCDILEKKLQQEDAYIRNDEEFYYTAGQCINFLVTRYTNVNKSFKKNLVAQHNLNCHTPAIFKIRLIGLFKKCANIVYMNDHKFSIAMSIVMGYEPEEEKINHDALMLGYMEKNILQ